MNIYIKLVVLIGLVLCGISNYSVYANEIMSIDDYDLKNIQSILDENDYKELDFKEMIKILLSGESTTVIVDTFGYMLKKAFEDVNLAKECILNILLISIIAAFFSNFAKVFNQNTVSDSGFYICYISVMVVSITMFGTAVNIGINLIKLIIDFMSALVPSFFLSVGIVGQASAIGFYEVALSAIYIVNYLFANVVLPLIKVYVVLGLTNNLSSEDFLSRTIGLIKKLILCINKGLLAGVLGINVIQGLVLPQVDGLKNNALKKITSALPVVGDGSDYITNIFISSGALIKNSLGTVGIIVLICVCIIPVVKVFAMVIGMNMASAIIQPISDVRIIKCISYVSDGIYLLMRTIITAVLLFVISIAMVCVFTKI